MSTISYRIRSGIMVAVLGLGLAVALPAGPASAATLDGVWAGSVPACRSNSHIGTYSNNRIKAFNTFNNTYTDFGWLEWRHSNNGNCNGYQWARLHVEQSIVVWGGGWLIMNERRSDGVQVSPQIRPQVIDDEVCGPLWCTFGSLLSPGTYDAALLYSPNHQSCAGFISSTAVVTWDFARQAPLLANVCA
jgi:hypothetical protein